MPNGRNVSALLGLLLMAASAVAQPALLLDPSRAPITLKGGWEQKQGSAGGGAANSGDVVVKISKINPDGSFEGRLDFYTSGRWCRAADEPIKEGRITAKTISLVANGGPPATCGMMTFEFRPGKDKWMQGRLKSEAGGGAPMWLNAPK